MIHCAVQLIHRARAEGVTDLRPVERNADSRQIACAGAAVLAAVHVAVVGDVLQILEPLHEPPAGRVEDIGYLGWEICGHQSSLALETGGTSKWWAG